MDSVKIGQLVKWRSDITGQLFVGRVSSTPCFGLRSIVDVIRADGSACYVGMWRLSPASNNELYAASQGV